MGALGYHVIWDNPHVIPSLRWIPLIVWIWIREVSNWAFELPGGVIPLVKSRTTLPETNIAPENGWLEYFLVSFWDAAYFQVLLVC